MVRRLYGFDIVAVSEPGVDYERAVSFFARVRLDEPTPYTDRTLKGLLRIDL